MSVYLYRFGYETPAQATANAVHGWDDESSEAVLIEAESPEQALEWGREISNQFVRKLYEDPNVSWTRGEFAHWIEEHPEAIYSAEVLTTFPRVRCGYHPVIPTPRNA